MSIDKNHSEDFERYLKGQMSPEEAYAFERNVLDDPFAQEALEGFETFDKGAIDDLKKLRQGIVNRKQKGLPFMRIAAVVALLVIGSFTVYTFTSQIENEQLAMEEESIEEIIQNSPAPDTNKLEQLSSIVIEEELTQESNTESASKEELKLDSKNDDSIELFTENEEEPTSSDTESIAPTLVEEELALAETEIPEEVIEGEESGIASSPQEKIAGIEIIESDQLAEAEVEEVSVESIAMELSADDFTNTQSKRASSQRLNAATARSFSSESMINGHVTDNNGETLPGVNVVIKGTTTGVTTDLDGSFSLTKTDNMTLIFSFVGFESQEIEIGGRNTVDVVMGGATELQEVVITGVGKSVDNETFTPARPNNGKKSYKQYLESNLRYPASAKENSIEGTVILELSITASGTIDAISVKKSIGYGCDEEAIRLVKEGPKWNSAKKGNASIGDKVRVKVKFKLD